MKKSIVLVFVLAITASPSFAAAHLASKGVKASAKASAKVAKASGKAAKAALKFVF